jgi:hypothetical protein
MCSKLRKNAFSIYKGNFENDQKRVSKPQMLFRRPDVFFISERFYCSYPLNSYNFSTNLTSA